MVLVVIALAVAVVIIVVLAVVVAVVVVIVVVIIVVIAVEVVVVKVKISLEQATKAHEGEQMYSSTLPSTSTLDGVVVNATHRPLYSRERPGTHCTGG